MNPLVLLFLALVAVVVAGEMDDGHSAMAGDHWGDLHAWLHSACPTHTPPAWMLAELRESHPEMTSHTQSGSCEAYQARPPLKGANMPHPPLETTAAVPVPRVPVGSLSAREFYQKYWRRGLPMVLEGIPERWVKRMAKVGDCCRARIAALQAKYGNSCRGCEPRGGDWHLEGGVQLCGDSCGQVAGEGLADTMLRESLHSLFDLRNAGLAAESAGYTLLDAHNGEYDATSWVDDFDQMGYALLAREGAKFGNPLHFDESCHGTLSVQLEGRKQWMIWNPWELQGLPAHTRHVAELGPGDVIFYPPGWFHQTLSLRGDSVAAAFYVLLPPFGASLVGNNHSLWTNPLGFDGCIHGPKGWRQQSEALDLALQLEHSVHGGEL